MRLTGLSALANGLVCHCIRTALFGSEDCSDKATQSDKRSGV